MYNNVSEKLNLILGEDMRKILMFASVISFVNAEDCAFYAKLVKVDNQYIVESASKYYIDEPNVLKVQVANSGNISSMKVPYQDFKKGGSGCRAVGSNDHQALCSGDFVSKNIASSIAIKPFAYVLTLGIVAVGDAAMGFTYGTEANESSIMLAKEHSNIMTSSISSPFIQECKSYYLASDEKYKNELIERDRQNIETQKKIEKENNARKIATEKWMLSMQQYRKNLKAGDVTNCGTVIEVKSPMVHIQTGSDARDIWIKNNNIYSSVDNQNRVVGCKDDNRWYKRDGNWVQGGGREFYSTGINSYDFN